MRLLFLLGILVGFSLQAQHIELSVPPHIVGSELKLIAYQGLHERTVDSLKIDGVQVNLNAKLNEDGMAKLILGDEVLSELVLVRETQLNGTIKIGADGLTVEWNNSKENDALDLLLSLSSQYSEGVEKLSSMLDNIPQFHPQRETINDSLQAQYRTLLAAYNASLSAIKVKFPDTYTSDVLVGLDALPMREDRSSWLEEYDNDPAFLHRYFFENVPFGDGRTATNPYLKNKILEYIFSYIEKHEQGLKNAIDLIMAKADRNEEVKKACAEILIGFFTDQGISEYVDYLNQEHLASCSIDFDPSIGMILERSSPYRVGDQIESSSMLDFESGAIDLLTSEKPFNALMFYASWCSHCHDEIPQLEGFLTMNEEILQMQAISLDTLPEDLAAIQSLFPKTVKMRCDLKGWDSDPADKFGISATPSFILLSKEGTYLGRASSLVNLAMLLAEQQ